MIKQTQPSPIARLSPPAGGLDQTIQRVTRCVWPIRSGVLGAACLLFCLLCPPGQGCAHAAGEESKVADPLVIEPKIVNFGRVNDASGPLQLSFTISNRGDQPIEITRTRSGCGCTVVKLSESVVKPNDRVLVSVRLNIGGRRGKFENRVLLDVLGRSDPVIVPIQGTIIQDLWFDGPMIQCFVADSAPTVEKTFELHTVDWPWVRFDWKGLEKGLSIREISRSTSAYETVIRLRLRMDVAPDQSTTKKYAVLQPLDKRIKPLAIPVVCYRPSVRENGTPPPSRPDQGSAEKSKEAAPVLQPDRVSLGVVPRGEERRFRVSVSSELAGSLKVAGLDNFPEGTKVELHPSADGKKDSCRVGVRLGKSAPLGLVDGRIRLTSPEGRDYSIAVLGIVAPAGAGTKGTEASDGQDPDREPEAELASE